MPAFEQQISHLPTEQIAAKEADLRARLRLSLDKAASLRHVFICKFHRFTPRVDNGEPDLVDETVDRFNAVIADEARAYPNVRLIDTAAIAGHLGTAASFDTRFYHRSTAPYKPAFFNELARRILLATRGFNGYFYKALVLDCDNTLWGGIVGEDLLDGIRLDPHSYPGKVYWKAQLDFLSLERSGVLLCLCSKNNPGDVDEVLKDHPHSVLRDEHIAARQVNWADKVTGLRALAEQLNIGLDSLVFLDDSDFECTAVRTALPMVRVFQVPRVLTDYPEVIREIRELFLAGGVAQESRSKTAQYRQRQQAVESSTQYATHEEYLASLGLQVDFRENETASIPRISELTLKSNQFNLTTLRQTPAEIREKMESPYHGVYSLTVTDRFGSAGLTGVLLMRWAGDTAVVDAFLMSCRVIGRGVELSFWPRIAAEATRRGCRYLAATYVPSAKNAQVADFYDKLGLERQAVLPDGSVAYRSPLDNFSPPTIDWIALNHDQ
jgi:FkbH-like protein